MQATTHVDLLLRAEELEFLQSLSWDFNYNLATGISGLSNYRFGRPTTLPMLMAVAVANAFRGDFCITIKLAYACIV